MTNALRRTLVLAALVFVGLARPGAAALPPNFVDQLVANVGSPTALTFTPDGRLLITTQPGTLRVVDQNGQLLATPALTIPSGSICSNVERGLLGVAVDPNFASNNFIYLYYTFRNGASNCSGSSLPKNRVSRFTLPAGNVINPATELVLIDNMHSTAGNHNGGDLHFGKDGFLYVSVGDGGCDYAGDSGCAGANDASRDRNVLIGKVLRITAAGGIPAGNPFQGAGTARCNVTGSTTTGTICQETFAWGLRNPYRISFDPNASGTRFFINDVGQNAWEEIDLAQAGNDYGWNCREGAHTNNTGGPCSNPPGPLVDPIFEYQHDTTIPGTTSPASCNAITGGAFVPNGIWPATYDGTYLFSDFTCGWVARLSAGAPFTATDFATNLGGSSVVTMAFGPFGGGQALYYTTFASGGQVRRIFYSVAGNNPPEAVASASTLGGPVPLTVTFDATGSSDPDPGDTLTYFWTFGDGTPEASTTNLTIQHIYNAQGVFTVTLRARDNNFAFSPPVTLTVQPGNTPPVPTITVPAVSDTFQVGQLVNLTGSATDAEDGSLPSNRLSWTVILHHNTHTHPFLGPVTGSPVPMTAPAPEDLAATDTSFLEIRLTATDLANLPATVVRNFQPFKVPITFDTAPAGLVIPVNGFNLTGPQTVTSWAGYVLNVDAPCQGLNGTSYAFSSWSDTGAASHAITTPTVPTTYTATFQQQAPLVLDYFTVPPCRLVDTRNPNGPTGGPPLQAGGTRDFDVAGACEVPLTAKAVAVNVTVTGAGDRGHLQVYAQGCLPPPTSVINFVAAQTRANNALVTLGPTGALSVSCVMNSAGTTHVILDVVGYFE